MDVHLLQDNSQAVCANKHIDTSGSVPILQGKDRDYVPKVRMATPMIPNHCIRNQLQRIQSFLKLDISRGYVDAAGRKKRVPGLKYVNLAITYGSLRPRGGWQRSYKHGGLSGDPGFEGVLSAVVQCIHIPVP